MVYKVVIHIKMLDGIFNGKIGSSIENLKSIKVNYLLIVQIHDLKMLTNFRHRSVQFKSYFVDKNPIRIWNQFQAELKFGGHCFNQVNSYTRHLRQWEKDQNTLISIQYRTTIGGQVGNISEGGSRRPENEPTLRGDTCAAPYPHFAHL